MLSKDTTLVDVVGDLTENNCLLSKDTTLVVDVVGAGLTNFALDAIFPGK